MFDFSLEAGLGLQIKSVRGGANSALLISNMEKKKIYGLKVLLASQGIQFITQYRL